MTSKVSCPTCKTSVLWQAQSAYRPFCSKRCQLIDLGEWAAEGHKIPQALEHDLMVTEEMVDALDVDFLAINSDFSIEQE